MHIELHLKQLIRARVSKRAMSLKLASRVMVPLELLSIAGGNINGQNSFGNMVVFTKVKPRSSLIPGKSAKYVSNRNECFCSLKNTYKNIHRRAPFIIASHWKELKCTSAVE